MSLFGGNLATSTPAKPGGLFSSFNTGTPAAGQTSAFGAAPAAAAPAFGGFGTTATSQAPPAFGATQQPTLGGFGTLGQTAPTSTATTGFGGFGTAPQAQGTSLFSGAANTTNTGFGGFGTGTAAATSAAPAFGGFGSGTTVTSSTAGGFSGFGATATTSTAPAFGGFGTNQTTTGFGGIGTSFASNFGKPATSTVTPGFGSFGGTTNFMLGQPQQQAPQISAEEAFAQSIFNVSIFGDERDAIIAKWNYLQAMWGTGKSFYSQSAAPVEIAPHNYLCRFKAMGYSRLPGKENKYGLVALNFNKPLNDVRGQQQQLVNSLNGVFGNKPNLLMHIEQMKEHDEKKCQVVIYVEERTAPPTVNEPKRLFATEVANYLNQANCRAQLNNMGVSEVLALVQPDEDQLRDYMENPPKGIDPRMWRQARLDNPDSKQLIPVPIIGFNALKWRTKCQEHETEMHALYLQKVEKELADLRQRTATTTAKIMEHKRLLAELSHKILMIIVKQECTRKVGMALTPEEEMLRTKLENMQALISAPTQFKGRLSELLSQMRMQGNQYSGASATEYTIDKENEEEIKQFLGMQQKAMEVLTDTVTKDLKSLKIILDGMPELVRT